MIDAGPAPEGAPARITAPEPPDGILPFPLNPASGLPSSKGFLVGDDPLAAPVLDVPGLRCMVASPQMLLALKVAAHRIGEDEGDVRLLAGHLGLTTASEVLEVAEARMGDRLDPAARFFVEELFGVE